MAHFDRSTGRRRPAHASTPGRSADSESSATALARSLRQVLAEARRVDLSQSDPVVSARNAIGLVIPLAGAAALGNPATGVQVGVGALQTAFADRPGAYRLRLARMLGTALAAGVTAGLAAGFGANLVVSAVLLALCAFAAGLLLSAGPSAAQVGIAATASALVLGHLPQTPLGACRTGLLVFAGGAIQAVLAIAAWPLGRHGPERRALANLYNRLAALAEEPIDAGTSPPLGDAIADARAVLTGAGHDHGPSVEAYRVLLDEAVRARQDVLVLSAYADRLSGDGLTEAESVIRDELTSAGSVLRGIADVLQAGGALQDQATARLRPVAGSPADRGDSGVITAGEMRVLGDSLTERAAANRLRSLAGQLRAMVETARTGAGEGRTDEDAERTGIRLRDPIQVLRANLDLRSPALRHASRLAILVPLTDIVTRSFGMQRGYWVSLTILVVLRPDFGSTFQRSLLRVIGTLVGLLFASLAVHYLLGDWQPATILLLGVLFFGVRLAGPTNMALSSVFLAALVVLLLSLAGFPAHTTVVDRSIDTAVGGAIALLATLLWPSWERGQLLSRLADLLDAYSTYLQAIIDGQSTVEQRSAVRSSARLARSTAEASLDRARAEPVDSQGVVELGSAVLAHSHRLVHALTALDATRQLSVVYAGVPELRVLLDEGLRAIGVLAELVRGEDRPARFATLRSLHEQLTMVLTPAARKPADSTAATLAPELAASLIEATDRMVDSLNSIAAVLSDRARTVADSQPHTVG